MRISCFLSLLFVSFVYGQTGRVVIERASYAVDTLSQWQADSLPDDAFRDIRPGEHLDIGYNDDAAIWCKVTLVNRDTLRHFHTWLCFDNNHIDSLSVYDASSLPIIGDRTTGVSPFITTQAFEVELAPGERRTIPVRLKKATSFFDFSVRLRDRLTLRKETTTKIAVISFFLGIIFLLLVFNGILFFTTRKRTYGYYICYSVLSASYIAISSYYAKYLLFPRFLYFSELRVYTASFWLMTMIAFLCAYTDLRRWQPRTHRVIRWLNYLNLGVIVVSILLLLAGSHDYLRLCFLIGYLVFLAAIVVTTWAAVAGIRKRPADNVYVLLAFLPHFVWGLGIILKSFGIIQKDLHEDVLIYICLYEVFLFGYVLARDYIYAFQKNNHLMRDILIERENSVQATALAQVRERRNVANFIHDNLGSRIAYILQLLELGHTDTARGHISDLAADIRDLSHKILPKSLDDGALVPSLRAQAAAWNGILPHSQIDIHAFDFPENVPHPWVFDLYLIAMECISNALKHGQARQIDIELFAYPDAYVFQFTDDGNGFDIHRTSKGFGLYNIEKRIRYYGGTFEINSSPDEGTVVQITLPSDVKNTFF